MKISLCITVFNEEKHIKRLLASIEKQTRYPDEVVIVDGGSTDSTVAQIIHYESRIKNLKIVTKKGNRAVGRNEAIEKAIGEVVAITDAGCELDIHWLEEIIKPFEDSSTQVVSGYYKGMPQNIFEKSLVPYVLVMPDRVDEKHFLPATRSMAIRKNVWKELGGFPERYRWNEDYIFSKRIEKKNIPIIFAPKAIVYWFPRENIVDGWKMFYSFARGDAQAGIWRPKVLFLLFRVFVGIALLSYSFFAQSFVVLEALVIVGILYAVWATQKNYRYVNNVWGLLFLPMWQCISDSAVFVGTVTGFFERVAKKHE